MILKRSMEPDVKPKKGDLVKMHYVGRFSDGSCFDSSRWRQKPFEFVLGETEVIDGWDIMLETMAIGEIADLRIPPGYAYGEAGVEGYVPPNESLSFEVELLDIGTPMDPEPEESKAAEPAAEQSTPFFWDEVEDRESGKGRGYAWQATGSGSEICVTVPLSKDIKVKEVKVDIRTFSLSCKIGSETVIDSKVSQDVDMDESHWDFDVKDGNPYLLIYLAKLDPSKKWESLLEGGDEAPAESIDDVDMEVIDVDAALRMANAAVQKGTSRQAPTVIDTD
jgi:hypothetical protein